MKYRWSINVMTKTSGCLTIYCNDRKQAATNITTYSNELIKGSTTISFDSMSALPNIIVMDEIIAVTCCDLEMMYDVHKEDVKLHRECNQESEYPTDFSQEDTEGYK